jgi:Zn-dependent protease with chaperone function
MDFFQNQDLARRNTRVMVVLYLIAVAGVVIATDIVVAAAYLYVADLPFRPGTGPAGMLRAVPPGLYLAGAVGTVVVILSVSLKQMLELREGGSVVAEMVGARELSRDTPDPLEKRLLNVVEEMAIASGARVPRVYVMDDEAGINAFAAGYDVSNAVIAVTRGTLETLSRDELQGVIGHEFSHILNGDMWLNIKMIGVLSGIVFIGGIGSYIMRNVRSNDRDSRASDDSKSAIAMFLFGLALFVVGYAGMFFARLIKAAVSRQREFLADASSVQFTRNPDGIAGALDQIRVSGRGALVANRYAEDMSHMYFGQGISVWMSGLFDTHPPLDERIRRVRPGFQPSRYRQSRDPAVSSGATATGYAAASGFAGAPASDGQRNSDAGAAWGRSAGESAKLVGTLDAGKVDYAARLISRLPAELRAAMNDPQGAGAVLVATLLAPKQEVLDAQLAAIAALGDATLAARAKALMPLFAKLGRGFDLTLIDLSLPAIKAGTEEGKRQLLAALEAVIHADRRVSLHQFVVLTLVKTQLTPPAKPGAVKSKALLSMRIDAVLVLSLVAYAGRKPGADPALDREVEAAFAAGAAVAGMADARLLPRNEFSLAAAGAALDNLKAVAPLAKAILVKALFAVVSADGTIRLMEAELMRLIGAVLECPLPPLIEEIDPATLTG